MKTIANALPVDEARPQAFHVELAPVVAVARLFHALHGVLPPALLVPHLSNQIEDTMVQPLSKR